MYDIWRSLLMYFIAYIIVTLIGMFHTIFNITVLKMKSMKEGPGMGEGYERTKPWHPLYNIIIFPIFAFIYINSQNVIDINMVITTSLIWGIVTIVIDFFGWVVIKHPWSLTFKEFYIDYQPWITLIYIAIFLSPFIAYLFYNII